MCGFQWRGACPTRRRRCPSRRSPSHWARPGTRPSTLEDFLKAARALASRLGDEEPTKGRDQGTGLGLAVSHGIAQEHGGELTVETAPGQGANFILELPVEGAALPDLFDPRERPCMFMAAGLSNTNAVEAWLSAKPVAGRTTPAHAQGNNAPFRGPRTPSSTMNQPIRVKLVERAEESSRERTRRPRSGRAWQSAKPVAGA
jgi:hypothetical protein